MDCPTEQSLLAAFAEAALAHLEAVDFICHVVEAGSKHEFADARGRTEQTASKWKAAHLTLENHRSEHNCPARASTTDPTSNEAKAG